MPTKKKRRAASADVDSRRKLSDEERRKAEAEVPPADRAAFEDVMRRLIRTPPSAKKDTS